MGSSKVRETVLNGQRGDQARLARKAGLLYLLVGVFGGFAVGYVTPSVYVAGDAAATAANVLGSAGLVRAGILANLFQATVFVFLAMTLYTLLKHVSDNVARAMVILVAIATAMMCANEIFQFAALLVAADASYTAAFGAAGGQALVLLLMTMHHYGFLIAQIFFGLWLIPLGYLAIKSDLFPKALGVALIAGGVAYLIDLVAAFLAPELSKQIHGVLAIPPAIAEIWTLAYLLVRGVKTPRTEHLHVS